MVLWRVKLRRRVTLFTYRVEIRRSQLAAVWIMAVRTSHALVIHLALDERSPLVVLFLDLAVGVIDILFQQAGQVAIEKRPAGLWVGSDGMTAGMARCAGLDLRVRPRVAL